MKKLLRARRMRRVGGVRVVKGPPLEWTSIGQFVALAEHGNRSLAFTITPRLGKWLALAIEGKSEASVDGLLESHGHKNLGVFPAVSKAFAACEKFARAWMKARSAKLDCSCDEIGRHT